MQGRKKELVRTGTGERAGVGKRAQPETGEKGKECVCRPVGGASGPQRVCTSGEEEQQERPRGAFSRGPDVPEPMSLAMMRHGGSSVA